MKKAEAIRLVERNLEIVERYRDQLSKVGVKVPKKWQREGEYTVNALVLAYLVEGYPNTSWVEKTELTQFVKLFREVNDVQQARHLGLQYGFYIVSSKRGNFIPDDSAPPKASAYRLISLEAAHPAYTSTRRQDDGFDFDSVKAKYGYRCATCGSVEGEPNLRYPEVKTELQAGHMHPRKPLSASNVIPQCSLCNRADKNRWVYDERGRVIGVAKADVVIRSIRKGYIAHDEAERLLRRLPKLLSRLEKRVKERSL